MFKKIALTAVAFGLLVGSASAGELNIYGASAQYKFWSKAASTFLGAQTGCGTVNTAVTGKNYIAVCSTSGDTVRVTEAKSSEGVNSVQGALTTGTTNTCSANTHRVMASSIDFTSTPDAETGHYAANTGCVDVNVGASDVAAATFNQTTYGVDNWAAGIDTLEGPDGYQWWIFDASDTPVGPVNGGIEDDKKEAKELSISEALYTPYRPVVVPFSFFVNANVPVTDLTTNQVRNILSGKINNWNRIISDLNGDGTADSNDFPAGDSLPIQVCGRHAGSGTLATLAAHVIRGEVAMGTQQSIPSDGYKNGAPVTTYLNTSSSDLMRCVGGNNGAIGYADSDKVDNVATDTDGPYGLAYTKDDDYGMIRKVALDGLYSDRESIIDGGYGFWAAQWLYADDTQLATDGSDTLLSALVSFASSNAGLVAAGKDVWWVAQDEMLFEKLDDFKLQTPK